MAKGNLAVSECISPPPSRPHPMPAGLDPTWISDAFQAGGRPRFDMVRALGRILVRRPDGWRNRSIATQSPLVVAAACNGDLRVRLVRLPLAACERAQAERPIYSGNETEDHARLKIAAVHWMLAEGAKDPVREATAGRFRHDVYSQRKQWAVECGNTDAARIELMICYDKAPRLTVLPYQRMHWRDGSVRRLLAVDFYWPPSLTDWMTERRFPSAFRRPT